MLETGTYRYKKQVNPDLIFGCVVNSPYTNEPGIRDDDERDIFTYLDSLRKMEEYYPLLGMLAVYERRHLKTGRGTFIDYIGDEEEYRGIKVNVGPPEYFFKTPNEKKKALKAVIKIIDNPLVE